MAKFEALFDNATFKKGTQIDFSASGKGKLLTKIDGKAVSHARMQLTPGRGVRGKGKLLTKIDGKAVGHARAPTADSRPPGCAPAAAPAALPSKRPTLSEPSAPPQVGTIESPELVRALFDIYLGKDPVSADAKRGFAAGLAALLRE